MPETPVQHLARLIMENRRARYSGCRVDELKYQHEIDRQLVSMTKETEDGTSDLCP